MNSFASRSVIAAITGALTLSTAASAQNPEDFTGLLRPRVFDSQTQSYWTLEERMAHHNVPGIAVAVIEDGAVIYAEGFGLQQRGGDTPVDGDTLFSVGSVSKVATAALALRLHEAGVLDIDAPVASQLSSWAMPDQPEYDESEVTMRMILAHTAGFNLHGFGDFQPGEDLPSVYDTLNGASPARHDPLQLTFAPGSEYRYSGGGYTLAQLLIADVSGESFEDIARSALFEPLGMTRSDFTNPLPESRGNIARAHDRSGEAAALPRGYEAMPETAASGLWTSSSELGEMVAALIGAYRGDGDFLSQATATDMMTRIAPSQHGLGPRIEGAGEGYFFHHAGANNSYHTWIEGHLVTGDGLVVLTNGARGNGLHMEIRNAVADAMGWQINQPVSAPAPSFDTAHFADFVGRYTVDPDFPLALRQQMSRYAFDADWMVDAGENGLSMGLAGREGRAELLPLSPNRFIIDGFAMREGVVEAEFHRNARGEVESLVLHVANAQTRYLPVD